MDFLNYQNIEAGISIDFPDTWEILENYSGTVATFISPQEGNKDTFRENLNLIIQDLRLSPLTLEQYTELSVNQLEQVVTKFKPLTPAGPSELLNYPAHDITYNGRQGKFKLTWHSTWSIIDDFAYVLTCTGEKKRFKNYWPIFERMLSSFCLI